MLECRWAEITFFFPFLVAPDGDQKKNPRLRKGRKEMKGSIEKEDFPGLKCDFSSVRPVDWKRWIFLCLLRRWGEGRGCGNSGGDCRLVFGLGVQFLRKLGIGPSRIGRSPDRHSGRPDGISRPESCFQSGG